MSTDRILQARKAYVQNLRNSFDETLSRAFSSVNAAVLSQFPGAEYGQARKFARRLPVTLSKDMRGAGVHGATALHVALFQGQLPFYAAALRELRGQRGTASDPMDRDHTSRVLTSMQCFARDEIKALSDAANKALRRRVTLHLAGMSVGIFAKIVLEHQAQTQRLMVNALSNMATIYYRTLVNLHTLSLEKAGPPLLYTYGPKEPTSGRAKCSSWAGKTFTRAQIAAMADTSSPNPILSGGGVNCSHVWMPVDVAVK